MTDFEIDRENQLDEQRLEIMRDIIRVSATSEERINTLQQLLQLQLDDEPQIKPQIKQDTMFVIEEYPTVTWYLNNVMRNNILAFTISLILMNQGILFITEYFFLTQQVHQIIYYVLLTITLLDMLVVFVLIFESIVRLVQRNARLWIMVQIYVSTVLLFAQAYLFYEFLNPGTFHAIILNNQRYRGVLGSFMLYMDFVYFSSVAQATIGFGDIYPLSGYGRFTFFVQGIVSICCNAMLLSNWTQA